MPLPTLLEHSSSTDVTTYPSTTFQQTDVTTYPFRTFQQHICQYLPFYNIPAAQMSVPTLLEHSSSTDVSTYPSQMSLPSRAYEFSRCSCCSIFNVLFIISSTIVFCICVLFLCGHCIVWPSIYSFWLSIWDYQTFRTYENKIVLFHTLFIRI
jgi:hypothetical protein